MIRDAKTHHRGGTVNAQVDALLDQTFEFDHPRAPENRLYRMQTLFTPRDLSGAARPSTELTLLLRVDSTSSRDSGTGSYTCEGFSMVRQGESPVRFDSLEGYSYQLAGTADDKGQIFGIDHERFRGLRGMDEKPLAIHETYWVYNSFVDFHTFCNVFSEPTVRGKGIQDLRRIGDRIEHASARSHPPIDLHDAIRKGSRFDNGSVTLELVGITVANGSTCGLVAFDSGDSSYVMNFEASSNMTVNVKGYSRYRGSVSVSLDTLWPEKVVMDEVVVSKATMNEQLMDNWVVLREAAIDIVGPDEGG